MEYFSYLVQLAASFGTYDYLSTCGEIWKVWYPLRLCECACNLDDDVHLFGVCQQQTVNLDIVVDGPCKQEESNEYQQCPQKSKPYDDGERHEDAVHAIAQDLRAVEVVVLVHPLHRVGGADGGAAELVEVRFQVVDKDAVQVQGVKL